MKTLTRHLLYLATFLALLLIIAGLTLFHEAPVMEVLAAVLAIITLVVGVGWLSYRLNVPPKSAHSDSLYTNEEVHTPVS